MSIYIYKYDIGGKSISESYVLRPEGDFSEAPRFASSEKNAELEKLEKKVIALEKRLKESEDGSSARFAHIADLLGSLGETNRSIKDLEDSNNRINKTLAVVGTLFALTVIIIGFHSNFTIIISKTIPAGISQEITQYITNGVIQGMHILFQYVR